MKLSYLCKPKIKSKINGRNKKILQLKPTEPQKLCNYLNGLCLTSSVLYQATINYNDSKYKQKRYKEISKTTFEKS